MLGVAEEVAWTRHTPCCMVPQAESSVAPHEALSSWPWATYTSHSTGAYSCLEAWTRASELELSPKGVSAQPAVSSMANTTTAGQPVVGQKSILSHQT
jgi:hypothetical protein